MNYLREKKNSVFWSNLYFFGMLSFVNIFFFEFCLFFLEKRKNFVPCDWEVTFFYLLASFFVPIGIFLGMKKEVLNLYEKKRGKYCFQYKLPQMQRKREKIKNWSKCDFVHVISFSYLRAQVNSTWFQHPVSLYINYFFTHSRSFFLSAFKMKSFIHNS